QGELAAVHERVERILNDLRVLQRESHVWLLENPAVVEALALTADEQTELTALLKKRKEERETFWHDALNLDEETRRRESVRLVEKYDAKIGEILSLRQIERLKQLAIQSQGVSVFKEPEIVDELSITAAQRKAMRAIE